ncbi:MULTISPECIES: hypothetical protein [unclassified Streptomyces]|uniref:hypothetical protein n=1 Tax=unclassified Streptomyces TaxID=2593676 RepID=UPI0033F016F9
MTKATVVGGVQLAAGEQMRLALRTRTPVGPGWEVLLMPTRLAHPALHPFTRTTAWASALGWIFAYAGLVVHPIVTLIAAETSCALPVPEP